MSSVNFFEPQIKIVKEVDIFESEFQNLEILPQITRKEFEGDFTIVLYPFLKFSKSNIDSIGELVGQRLVKESSEVQSYNVVKGFLNLTFSNKFFFRVLNQIVFKNDYGHIKSDSLSETILVEYSSPNTNKPLHLGHIRNNLLGSSVANILEANGKNVFRVQIINDRGIHICKSMLSWKKFAKGETPESANVKGDHLVGKYYIEFENNYQQQVKDLVSQGFSRSESLEKAPILEEAKAMLRDWEKGDSEVLDLWKKLNNWVYQGFDQTYKCLGIRFDKNYYESQTYLLGKQLVKEGLEKGLFSKRDDGSVWIDLADDGLDQKLLLRSDGTAVYMTQDLGTAVERSKDFPKVDGMVYTVGNEQNYHFQVLFLILKKLGYSWADKLYHLSYGMVDLPTGKMKSREGTVVDADDLIQKMFVTAEQKTEETGKLESIPVKDRDKLFMTMGLGALKYFLLKIDPKKRILFNPENSVDFQGNTGTFVQYTYARINTLLSKSDLEFNCTIEGWDFDIESSEKEIIKKLMLYPQTLDTAAKKYDPSIVCNYVYDLVKAFNHFYQNVPVLSVSDKAKKQFRVILCKEVGKTLKKSCDLLGIELPTRM